MAASREELSVSANIHDGRKEPGREIPSALNLRGLVREAGAELQLFLCSWAPYKYQAGASEAQMVPGLRRAPGSSCPRPARVTFPEEPRWVQALPPLPPPQGRAWLSLPP